MADFIIDTFHMDHPNLANNRAVKLKMTSVTYNGFSGSYMVIWRKVRHRDKVRQVIFHR